MATSVIGEDQNHNNDTHIWKRVNGNTSSRHKIDFLFLYITKKRKFILNIIENMFLLLRLFILVNETILLWREHPHTITYEFSLTKELPLDTKIVNPFECFCLLIIETSNPHFMKKFSYAFKKTIHYDFYVLLNWKLFCGFHIYLNLVCWFRKLFSLNFNTYAKISLNFQLPLEKKFLLSFSLSPYLSVANKFEPKL